MRIPLSPIRSALGRQASPPLAVPPRRKVAEAAPLPSAPRMAKIAKILIMAGSILLAIGVATLVAKVSLGLPLWCLAAGVVVISLGSYALVSGIVAERHSTRISELARIQAHRRELREISDQHRQIADQLHRMTAEACANTNELEGLLARATRAHRVLQVIQAWMEQISDHVGENDRLGPAAERASPSTHRGFTPQALENLELLRRSAAGCLALDELGRRLRQIYSQPMEPIEPAETGSSRPSLDADRRPEVRLGHSMPTLPPRLAVDGLVWNRARLENSLEELVIAGDAVAQDLDRQRRMTDRREEELRGILRTLGVSDDVGDHLITGLPNR